MNAIASIGTAMLVIGCTSAEFSYDAGSAPKNPQEGTAGMASIQPEFPIYSAGSMGGSSGQGGAGPESLPSCLRLLSLGSPAASGVVPGAGGLDAVVAWLNERSNAVAEHLAEPAQISAERLSKVDVLLLQDLSGWHLTTEDSRVLADWIGKGGAAVVLAGYEGASDGIEESNKLLSFSGLNFVTTGDDTATALGDCGFCLGSSIKVEQFQLSHPISRHVEAIGAFLGRSVLGEGELILSKDAHQLGVTKEYLDGRVMFYHDDWITYVPLWSGEISLYCDTNPSCSDQSPTKSYQVAQFWYNALRWAAPNAACFRIDDPNVIVD